MKKKMGVMDRVLIVIAVVLIVFTATMVVVHVTTGSIPDTLCTCVFTVCGGECGIMGWIKTTKERKQERKYELQDRKYENEEEKTE